LGKNGAPESGQNDEGAGETAHYSDNGDIIRNYAEFAST
jgi:hypothetical protein